MHSLTRLAASVLLALSTLAAAPAMAAPAAAQTAQASAAYDLDADVAAVLKTFDVPGLSVAVVKDGKVLVARGFGVRRLGDPTPVDGKTLFEIASNSKGFTTVALAMLVDEGKLAWDDPVSKHLPGFRMYDPYVSGALTVRDLVSHRSGLGLGAGDLLWWPTTTYSVDEIIERLRYIPPTTSFRHGYAYQNLPFIVAGKIIAEKSGQPWGATIRARILDPLGMKASTTSLAEHAANPNVSAPHSKIDGKASVVKPVPADNAVGAVGVNSNAEELARWMTVLMEGGKYGADDKARLFSQKQAAELWSAQTPIKISEPKAPLAATKPNFSAYGLGFQLRDYQGKKVVQHGGALQGFYSRVLMVPEAKLGIAILTNAESGGAISALQWRLLDQHLGVAPSDWIGRVHKVEQELAAEEEKKQKAVKAARVAGTKPSLALAAYDGKYSDPWYGEVSIAAEGAKRVMRFGRSADLEGGLEHWQYDTFIVRWKERNFNADAYVTFSLKPDGSIERMKMAPLSEETDFSYDFADLTFTPVKPAAAKK